MKFNSAFQLLNHLLYQGPTTPLTLNLYISVNCFLCVFFVVVVVVVVVVVFVVVFCFLFCFCFVFSFFFLLSIFPMRTVYFQSRLLFCNGLVKKSKPRLYVIRLLLIFLINKIKLRS